MGRGNGRAEIYIDWFAVERIPNPKHRLLFAYVAANAEVRETLERTYPACFLRKPLVRRRKVSLRDVQRSSRNFHEKNHVPPDQLDDLSRRAIFPVCPAYRVPVLIEWGPDEEGGIRPIPEEVQEQLMQQQFRLGLTVRYLELEWTVVYYKPRRGDGSLDEIAMPGIHALSLAPAECFIF